METKTDEKVGKKEKKAKGEGCPARSASQLNFGSNNHSWFQQYVCQHRLRNASQNIHNPNLTDDLLS